MAKLIDYYHHESRNTVYTVFENAGSINLAQMVNNPTNQWNHTARRSVMMQLMKAVEHLHKNGVVHNDLKPENVVLK